MYAWPVTADLTDVDLELFSDVERILNPPTQDWNPEPHQIPPAGKWFVWVLMGGRGTGKTAAAAKYLHDLVHGPPMIPEIRGGHWISIVGPTKGDAVTSCVKGPSGLIKWDPGVQVLSATGGTIVRWSNGVEGKIFGTDQPGDAERFRAGGNRSFVWAEELAAWRQLDECWKQIRFGLRSGVWPHMIVTSTPKPRKTFVEVVHKCRDPKNLRYQITQGTTDDNPHLDKNVKAELYEDYANTRLGRQELFGDLLEDVENALWISEYIDSERLASGDGPRHYDNIVVAVDPQAKDGGAETGIIVAGRVNEYDHMGRPHGFVIADESTSGTPDVWAQRAVRAYHDYQANYIVAEVNNGGDMVKYVIASIDPSVPVKAVSASRGKAKRAEPVALWYERGLVHHIGMFSRLEDQMLRFDPFDLPDVSPDRMDAMVWAFTELLVLPAETVITKMRDVRLHGRR